ncbi:MAG: hypothetical protein K0R61_2967 [Microvirga sp.]|jgi:hypothetical protein|nr:hypothetical protein [Microvirga sp.]
MTDDGSGNQTARSSPLPWLPCCQPAMPNGRCRLHGGLSTGPRTPEGLKVLESELEAQVLFGRGEGSAEEGRVLVQSLRQ